MKIKMFVIDGGNFSNLEGFWDEVKRVLIPNLSYFGRNYDAFDEILYGGFGEFDEGEEITLIWKNFSISRRRMNSRDLKVIFEIIESHKSINFKVEE